MKKIELDFIITGRVLYRTEMEDYEAVQTVKERLKKALTDIPTEEVDALYAMNVEVVFGEHN